MQKRNSHGQRNGLAHEILTQIASAPQNSYSLRLEATSALSGIHNGLDLGSAELNLLAGETKTITSAEADHPFFYDARLKAAQNTPDPRAKIQILAKALADTPAREDARIPLFQAALRPMKMNLLWLRSSRCFEISASGKLFRML